MTIDSFISLHLGEPLLCVFTWMQPDANTGECGYCILTRPAGSSK